MRTVIILFFLFSGLASHAQISRKSSTKGLNIAASGNMLGWTSRYFSYLDENASNGGGGGLSAGYGMTELIEPCAGIRFYILGVRFNIR